MSRSYKKYPKGRHRKGRMKRFCRDYNRYIRHTKPDFVDGAHYRKTNASYHAYDKRNCMPTYYSCYYSAIQNRLEYEERQARHLIGYYSNWSVSHTYVDETYEENYFNYWKYHYAK